MLLLAADFYYLKNIAGRRLVGLRWWNEVNTATGDSHWVFESQDRSGSVESGAPTQNATDKRFFWLALYAQPALWVILAIVSLVRLLNPIWLSLVVPPFQPIRNLSATPYISKQQHAQLKPDWSI
ncbi:MAG: hypothetical protein LQ343_004236 [Gyalolechia ehrenbergii]|nr:MAG: hypothetical protein LQ343_004236 [Gyalolechia ehrenbergii]